MKEHVTKAKKIIDRFMIDYGIDKKYQNQDAFIFTFINCLASDKNANLNTIVKAIEEAESFSQVTAIQEAHKDDELKPK